MEKEKNSAIEYLNIFWTMFKIGITTFGGGYAMIAIIQKELAQKKQWMTEEEMLDYMAIAQITPGIIAVNISTFVGNKRKGILGGIIATLGVIAPSVIIILIIAALLSNFADNEFVKHAFAGIRICACALVVNAAVGFFRKTVIDVLTLVTFIAVFIVAAFTRVQTVYIVLVMIAVSVVITLIKGRKIQ